MLQNWQNMFQITISSVESCSGVNQLLNLYLLLFKLKNLQKCSVGLIDEKMVCSFSNFGKKLIFI